jgi:tetratricopeptide (TPR) repeat protein
MTGFSRDDIAQRVLESLRVVLTPQQKAVITTHNTTDPEVLDRYLRARKILYERMDMAGLDTAMHHLREAIARDPSFVDAYVALAEATGTQAQMRGDIAAVDSITENSARRRLLETAIALDPSNADAHATLGLDLAYSMDLDGARQALARAEALNPNGELVLRCLGRYYGVWGWPPEKAIGYTLHGQQLDPLNPWAIINLGIAYTNADRFEQALLANDRALELNPSFWVGWWHRNFVLFELGRYAEAVEAARRALELSGGYVDVNADLIVALAAAGNRVEAEEIFRRMEAPTQRPRWRPAVRAYALAGLGRHEETLAALEEAVRIGDGFIAELLYHRLLVPLHDEPRFMRIVKELEQERRVERLRQRLKISG